jgi:polyphosphate kinase 2 (PPK2 family)
MLRPANEMFKKTDTNNAHWVLIVGNNKRHTRINVLIETIKQVEQAAIQ